MNNPIMFIASANLLFILEKYKYLLIFPIVVIEGPIIIVISGFLIYLGYLNIYVAFPLLVIGDLTGDALNYVIGKYWRRAAWIRKYGHFLGYSEKSEKTLENHFKKHKYKTFLLAKISHGVGRMAQIAAGIAEFDFLEYLWINLIGTIPKTTVLLIIGYYIGGSYLKINSYLNFIAFISIGAVLLIFLYIILNNYQNK